FDDPAVGLVREPFVLGIPAMIDRVVADIPNSRNGVRLLFLNRRFPNALKLDKLRDEAEGAWYRCDELDGAEGWLCPAMFHYFQRPAPSEIYVTAEPLQAK